MNPKFEIERLGAFGIIQDLSSRVLLCHRTDMDAWNLPGGGVGGSETPWEAVVREVEEEVGLETRVDRLLGLYVVPDQNVLAFLFRCQRVGGRLRHSREADDIQWFTEDNLPSTTLATHVERIVDAMKPYSSPVLRVQVPNIT